MPSSTGQAPVVSGGLLKGKVGLDLSSSVPVTVINDITTNPVTRNEVVVGRDDNYISDVFGLGVLSGSRFILELGLLEKLDLYYTNAFGARYMVWGEPDKEGWRATVFFGVFNGGSTTSTTTGGITYDSNIRNSGQEYGVSVGNQFRKLSLAYLTLASRGGDSKIKISESEVERENYHDEFEHYIATLGFIYGLSWYLKIEASFNSIKWTGSNANGVEVSDSGTDTGGTLGFGYRW